MTDLQIGSALQSVVGGKSFLQISNSTLVKSREGHIIGLFVSSASGSPTIQLWDDSSSGSGTLLVDSFTPLPGSWYPLPFHFKNGLYATVGGTVSCTLSFD